MDDYLSKPAGIEENLRQPSSDGWPVPGLNKEGRKRPLPLGHARRIRVSSVLSQKRKVRGDSNREPPVSSPPFRRVLAWFGFDTRDARSAIYRLKDWNQMTRRNYVAKVSEERKPFTFSFSFHARAGKLRHSERFSLMKGDWKKAAGGSGSARRHGGCVCAGARVSISSDMKIRPAFQQNALIPRGPELERNSRRFTSASAGILAALGGAFAHARRTAIRSSSGSPSPGQLLLHTLNVMLLFFLLNKITGSTWRSGLVAALFRMASAERGNRGVVAQRAKSALCLILGS